jgi:hypothetical protein
MDDLLANDLLDESGSFVGDILRLTSDEHHLLLLARGVSRNRSVKYLLNLIGVLGYKGCHDGKRARCSGSRILWVEVRILELMSVSLGDKRRPVFLPRNLIYHFFKTRLSSWRPFMIHSGRSKSRGLVGGSDHSFEQRGSTARRSQNKNRRWVSLLFLSLLCQSYCSVNVLASRRTYCPQTIEHQCELQNMVIRQLP